MNWNHGGDVTGYRRTYGREPLDFSASLNPFGMPARVAEAARRAVDASVPYPDPFCRELGAALAARLDVPEERIVFGNGAAEVIFRLALAVRPRAAVIPAPSFAEYEQALDACGCRCDFYCLDRQSGFRLDEGIAGRIVPRVDLLFLCQPNNPTGRTIERDLLRALLERCEACGVTLVADECFLPFVDARESLSLLPDTARSGNLVVLGSFTKLYAMAGLRLGYAVCGDAALAASMRRAGPPWSVSTVAQAAGLAALGEEDYERESLAAIREEKEFLCRELAALGLEVRGSAANYIFFFSSREDLADALLDRGIMIRDCADFRGVGPGFFRVGVRLRDDNRRLIAAIKDVLDQ